MSSQARKSKAEVGEVMTEANGWSDTRKVPLETEKSKEMDSPLRNFRRNAGHLRTPLS